LKGPLCSASLYNLPRPSRSPLISVALVSARIWAVLSVFSRYMTMTLSARPPFPTGRWASPWPMNQGPAVSVIRSVQVPRPADNIVFTVSAELPAGRSARGHCIRAPVPGDGDSPHAGQPRPVPSGVFGADSRTL